MFRHPAFRSVTSYRQRPTFLRSPSFRAALRTRLLGTLLAAALVPAQAQAVSFPPLTAPLLTAPVMTVLTPDEVLELMESGRLDEAEQAARAAAAAHPESARAQVVLARILARQERLDEARAVLAQAQALPQWEEQNIRVPFKSPKAIDRVMQRDPARALGMIADVLLAEGDDPKAYYLQSLALVQLGRYDQAQAALNQAREHGDVTVFAHPDTLARLEQLLRERPSTPPTGAAAGPGLEPPKPLPWWVWAGVGAGAGALGWWGIAAWQRAAARAKAERKRALYEAGKQLDADIFAAQQALAAGHTPELERRLGRLRNLQGQLRAWERGDTDGPDITRQFGALLAASQSDASWQEYQDDLAQQAAEEAAEEAHAAAGHQNRRGSDGPSSFRDDTDSSWSSGSSGSGGGNNGGSSW
ncbi:hypothetical protein Deipr_1345 [Deinococcus proteolyticus MRP]|uniref:Tetratricopeptide TPR_2 repeat-containing protein n=1 Tax=Deinococcus proteolyticus (strain ATCC 35074 / DSM 20540 / JCM 6276 / NBRC 101906 / NCIMB 13154 / VKM Ac-1939 / CCM 2703 / MRP) TaxID=693977 RepID=F0RJ57_DEIPM|nr:hypothetical protein Deipr_1345 [Deinococcus proteolyticus MRP]